MTPAQSPAEMLAAKMNKNQRSTILGLDATPCLLGCAEATAARLAKSSRNRPALTIATQGERYKLYALSPTGVEVKAVLERTEA